MIGQRSTFLLLALVVFVALAGSPPRRAAASVSEAVISSAGPLTKIHVGVDLSCQVEHTGDSAFEFYPPDVTPGDCGTMVAINGVVYSPDFNSHDGTAAQSLSGTSVPFTPVSQTAVTGTGTAGDPYQVVTIADAGTTGLRVAETDTYVVGSESYRTDVQVQNTSNSVVTAIIYRAGDCYLGGSDRGYGLAISASKTIACTATANNSPAGRIEEWSPITPADHYLETGYNEVWVAIATGTDLPDTCDCATLEDNGAGINWDRTIAAGQSVTLSHLTTFSPVGTVPLVVSKTADQGSVGPGAQDGYTISISNPNVADITVSTIIDTLPAGFAYVPGSSTGITTTDPGVSSQTLTWTGPFTIAGDGSPPETLHFDVTVAQQAGTYTNTATVGGADAVPAVDVAPIVVTGATPTATSTVSQTPTATPTQQCGTPIAAAAIAQHDVSVTTTAVSTRTVEATRTVQITQTAQVSQTPQSTRTARVTTTSTTQPTATATATDTPIPTATNTATPTATTTASTTATATASATPTCTPGQPGIPQVRVATSTPTRTPASSSTPIQAATGAPATTTPVSGVLGVETGGRAGGPGSAPSQLPNSGSGGMRGSAGWLLSVATALAAAGMLTALAANARRRSRR
ncbi:MAG TPA: hypothetical protein VEZ14_05035 [Dehalococcoidia bacterium]|nr:hypothetical protein [Dehalococcoidia bacterium]